MDAPLISPVAGYGQLGGSRTRLYNNPHFDYLSGMLPQDIKQLFQWCEYVSVVMPHLASGMRKLINYPVTDFSYESDAEQVRAATRALVTKTLKLKTVLLEFGYDWYVYGNVFRSISFPFKRFLVCQGCGKKIAIEEARYKVRGAKIELACVCGRRGAAGFDDQPRQDPAGVTLVRWNPKLIELQQNPITEGTIYYYKLPRSFVAGVRRGDLIMLRDSPKAFIDAALAGRNIAFGSNFYHAKTPRLSGYASGWGISQMLGALKPFMYIAVLRRAAEAIGMEHITPQRILFPQTNGSSDPALLGSMRRWQDEIRAALERWRLDPNYVMTAPFPTGVTNVGSQGRALAPIEEIKDARNEMALALDIPPGILMGDTTIQNSAVGLRILENQLAPTIDSLQQFTDWVIDTINIHQGKHFCPVKLIPFRLADDVMNKQLLMSALGSPVSRTTVQESLNLDPDQERERLRREQLDEYDSQKEVEQELRKREQSLAARARDEEEAAQGGGLPAYNQQKLIARAQEQAAQLLGVPYEQRKSVLAQLQNEDYVMWALVSKQLESLREQEKGGY